MPTSDEINAEVDMEIDAEFKRIMTEGFVDVMAQAYQGALAVAINNALRTVGSRHGLTRNQLKEIYDPQDDKPTQRH
tara:strand:+ start:317 stop:547 length:231 start_codon:yes stop_codon:yes gene_type:complete